MFPTKTTTYGRKTDADAGLSRYERARREWDDRIGTARVQAFHWRVIALLSVVGMIALGLALAMVSARKDIRTYVIEIDRLGQPARISLVNNDYEPQRAQIGYFVGQLVQLVRSRPLDPVVVRDNWKKAYAYLAGDAVQAMNAYAAADPHIRTVHGRQATRVVEITNVLPKSDESYQVRWRETDYVGGEQQAPEYRTGLFHVTTHPPRDESEVFRNPLGIYVVNFSWSKEFTDPVPPRDTSIEQPLEPTKEQTHEPMPE